MAQHDTAAPPGGMTYFFGQKVEYCARILSGDSYEWCPAFVICPTELRGEIGVAYFSRVDGHQWTDHAKLENVRPVLDDRPQVIDEFADTINAQAIRIRDLITEASELEAAVDTAAHRNRDLQVQLDRYRELFATMKLPSSEVPGWAVSCAGTIQKLAQRVFEYQTNTLTRNDLTTIIELTRIIRSEPPSVTSPSLNDLKIEPDKPF